MASIYDFAPSSSDSIKPSDLTSNYGFNVIPNASGIPYEEHFLRGLKAYANYEKDPLQQKLTHEAFGKNLPNKQLAPFFVGNAIVNQLGFNSVSQAYIAYNIPIPENVSDVETLTSTLGRNILDQFSQEYDAQQAIAADKAKKAASQLKLLVGGNLRVADLSPSEYKDFSTIYNFSPQDAIVAGQLNRMESKRSLKHKIGAAIAMPTASIAQLLTLNSDSSKDFRKDAEKLWEQAWGNRSQQYAQILQLADNPSNAIQIAQHAIAERARQDINSSNLFSRAIGHAADTAASLADASVEAGDYINQGISSAIDSKGFNSPSADSRQGTRVTAALADSKAATRESYNEQNGMTGLAESVITGVTDIAPFASPWTAAPSMVDLFTKNAGRSFSTLANDNGSLSDSISNAEVYSKAAADSLINYGSRAIGMKYLPRAINRKLTKWGVNSTLGHYAATSAVTGANFATVVPAMDASARWIYDAAFSVDSRIANGRDSLTHWLTQELPSARYLATQMGIGMVMGASSTFSYHRAAKLLSDYGQIKGLSQEQAESLRSSHDIADLPDAIDNAVSTNLRENPQAVVDNVINNSKKIIDQTEQDAIKENGHRVILDAAKLASLRLQGISLADGKDSDHVTLLTGGKIDPVTGKYIDGSGKVELSREQAAFYLGTLFDFRAELMSHVIREDYGRATLIDAIRKNLSGKIKIDAVLDPFIFSQIISKGKEAQSLIDKRTKEIIDSSKADDGKPTISESDARSQAAKEIHKDLDPSATLQELVAYGKEADTRVQIETQRNRNIDPDATFISEAWVVSKNSHLPAESRTRIFKITNRASTRDIVEEYGEQWLKDYLESYQTDITDAWRILDAVNQHINAPNISVTSISGKLADSLRNGATSDTLDLADLQSIRHDLIEGLSALLVADLRNKASLQDGSLPSWATPLFDAKLLLDHRMQQEFAIAAALDIARSVGKFNDTALRLLDAAPQEVQRVFHQMNTPTVDSYLDTYYQNKLTYENLVKGSSRPVDQVDAILAQQDKADSDLAATIKAQDDERSAPLANAVKQAESLPENKDKSHTQIVEEVNAKALQSQKQDIADSPSTVDDPDSSNGKASIKYADGTTACRFAVVPIANLSMMPNFKSGADKDTGEVDPLTGDYHPTHDPIRILRRTDGSLMVISGRHRLAHAKRFNATEIPAYIFDETPEHDLAWAQQMDIEWNIQDNQASALDVALLIRGELIQGKAPLSDKDIERIGILRGNKEARRGYDIAVNASPELMDAFRNGLDPIAAQKIALAAPIKAAPFNSTLQRKGISYIQDGKSANAAISLMAMDADQIQHLIDSGVAVQLDLFGTGELDSTYSNFVNEYAQKKVDYFKKLIKENKTLKDWEKMTPEERQASQLGSVLKIDMASLKRRLKSGSLNPYQQIHIWQHPWTNKAAIGKEIDDAFAKKHPQEWADMQARLQNEINTAQEDPSPDLGNSVQGDLSGISELNFSIKAQQGTATAQDADTSHLFDKGVMHTANAIITTPTADFSLAGLHASAHNFRKFDTSYMGTGEGAQAYGWGLYFAENPRVNRAYFHQFNKEHTTLAYQQDGNRIQEADYLSILDNIFVKHATPKYPAKVLVSAMRSLMSGKYVNNWNIDAEIQFLTNRINENPKAQEAYSPLLNALIEIRDKNLTIALIQEFATNYKVRLNVSKDDLLSWDEAPVPIPLLKAYLDYCKQNAPSQKTFSFADEQGHINRKISGKQFYEQYLVPTMGNPKAASMWLLSQGYKGIKHLDGFSRTPKTKNKTHNFIIFRNEDIKITAVNETGKWSLTDGWQAYSDPEANFSIRTYDTLQAWQLDPTAGLGSLGHFADNISRKFAPVGDDFTDKKFAQLQAFIQRRMAEIQNMNDSNDIDILLAELAMIDDIVALLPQGYRFGTEPYKEFLNTYATLIKHADPRKAGQALPMYGWDKKMRNSFNRTFNRIFLEDMFDMEKAEFEDLYSPFLTAIDITSLRSSIEDAREQAGIEFDFKNADRQRDAAYKADRRDAQRKAEQQTLEANQHIKDAIFQAIGQMRAARLVDKLLARVFLKMEQYRKDRTLAKIANALASITPRTQKDGKPVRGSVSQDTYNTALTNYRLLRLTKYQKDTFDLSHQDLADKEDSDLLQVETFDEEGAPITLTVTKQQYETYASLESMSADHAVATAQTLGTLIATGKEAWQLQAEQETKTVADFCTPIYKRYGLDENQRAINLRTEHTSIFNGIKSQIPAIKRVLVSSLNDAQLLSVISSIKGLEQFKQIQRAIADAHKYIETSEKQTHLNIIKSMAQACGFPDADPLHLTPEQHKAIVNFSNNINDRKEVSITLTPQAPDFHAQLTTLFHRSFLKRCAAYMKRKNHDPNALAVVLDEMEAAGSIPQSILNEARARFGSGDSSLYFGDPQQAFKDVLPENKFAHLHNINETIQERAAEQLQNWQITNTRTPVTITELTRNEAAYRVLMSEQSDYTDLMRRQGYTPQVIQQLKDFAGADMMQLAYTLRSLLNQRMPQLKAIYEATYGTPFPAVDNYFRAFFDAGTKEKNDSQLEGIAAGAEGKGSSGIKLFHTRIKHNASILPTMSVTQAFHIGMKQQTNLIAYTDPTTHRHYGEFLRRVLANKHSGMDLSKTLDHAIGAPFRAALETQVDNMYRIYGHAEAYNSTANRAVSDISAANATAILAGRITSIVKNSMAIFNTLGGSDQVTPAQWAASMARVTTGQGIKSVSDLAKDPLIRDRFKEWDTESYIETCLQLAGVKSAANTYTKLAKRGLSAFGAFDRSATAYSAAVMYDAAYRVLKKKNPNMDANALDTEAMAIVAQSLGVKGQPLDFKQRPLLSQRNSFLTSAFYFLGGEAWSTLGDLARLFIKTEFKHLTNFKNPTRCKNAWNNLANFSSVWLVNGMAYSLLNIAFAALLDDEETWRKRNLTQSFLWGSLLGPFQGIPIISNIANSAVRLFDADYYVSTPSYLPMTDLYRAASEISDIWDSKSSAWDKIIGANNTIRTLCIAALTATQRPTSKTGAITKATATITATASNIFDFIFRTARAADERWITPVPQRPAKDVKMSKQSRELNKAVRKNNADDLLNFTP